MGVGVGVGESTLEGVLLRAKSTHADSTRSGGGGTGDTAVPAAVPATAAATTTAAATATVSIQQCRYEATTASNPPVSPHNPTQCAPQAAADWSLSILRPIADQGFVRDSSGVRRVSVPAGPQPAQSHRLMVPVRQYM